VCFFFSFFWAFFDAFLSPTVEIGLTWPPKGILPLSPLSVPLLNTVILLVSGITVTWSHHAIVSKDYQSFIVSLFLTISLGGYFTYLQYTEYCTAPFSISDGIYGRTFFVATGFHGIHVMVGATYLAYVLVLASQASLTSVHHFSFEAARWYWHFVDVVWIFLFLNIYVAGAVS
jgi:cytochrome c oxidase subunit 3